MPLSQLAVTATTVTAKSPSARAVTHATRDTRDAQGAPERRPAAETNSSAMSMATVASTGAQRTGRPAKTPRAAIVAVRRFAVPKTTEARREGMRGTASITSAGVGEGPGLAGN